MDIGRDGRIGRIPGFAVTFALCFGLTLTWAAATPMFGVPDETDHMVRAAGAALGDIYGRPIGDSSLRTYQAPVVLEPDSTVAVVFDAGPIDICYAGVATQDASCMILSGDKGERRFVSRASSYPPLYYLLVGWPSRLLDGTPSLYAMRAASAAVFAALLALAVTSLGYGRRWATGYVGLAIATTPMVWFLGGSVNPSSTAIAAGIAAWCGGFRLVTAAQTTPLSRCAWRFGLPLCLLLLVRRDSIIWAGLIVVALTALIDRDRLGRFVRSRHVLGWGAATIACAVYAAITTANFASDSFRGDEAAGSAPDSFGAVPYYIDQMIGVLGWLDTTLPWPVYTLSYATLGAALLAALGFANRRLVAVEMGVVITLLAAVAYIGAQRYPYFQGRYAMPFAAGVPLLAGFGLATARLSGRLPRRPIVVAFATTAVVHLLAYYQQFRRYAISGERTWWIFTGVRWRPPTAPIPVLLVANLVLLVSVLGWWFLRCTAADNETPRS